MCVCGEIGYAQITSGRHSGDGLGDGARAFDLPKHGRASALSCTDDVVGRSRRGDVAVRDRAGEASRRIAGDDRLERDDAR